MSDSGERDQHDVGADWSPSPETPDDFGDQIERRFRQTRLASLFLQSPSFMAVLEGPEHVFVNANPTLYDLMGGRDLIGRAAREAVPELEGQGFFELLDQVYETGEPHVGSEAPVRLARGPDGALETVHVSYSYHPLRDDQGDVSGVLAHGIDVTERVRSRRRLRRRLQQQTAVAELGRSVLTISSLPEILRRVVTTAVETLGADGGELYRHESEGDRLFVEASAGVGHEEDAEPELEIAPDHLPGRAFLEERSLLSRNADGSGGDSRDTSEQHLAAPLPGGDDGPIGVLVVHAGGEDGLSEEDVPVLQAMAQIAGAAVSRRESRRFTETVVRNLPGLLYRCRNDRAWTMEYLSEGTETLTGFSPEQLTGEEGPSFADLIHPDDRERVWREVQRGVRDRRSFHLQYRIRTRGGEEKWVWEQGRGVRPETGESFVLEGYIFDITDREEARREASRLESVVGAAFRGSPDALFVVQLPERRIEECNAAAEELFGYGYDELIGRSVETLHVDREHYERFGALSRQKLRESGSYRGQFEMQRKDGTVFPTEHSITYVESESGEPARSLSIVRDISDRKRRQHQLERSRELLRDYARHVTDVQEEERTAIAREIHDELGQSLTALGLQLQQLRGGTGEDDLEREKLDESLDMLRSLIGQVRDLSTSLRPGTLDDLGLWKSLAQLTRDFEEKTGLDAEFDMKGSPDAIDPERQIHVYRVVQEALTNVARHADAGSARVEIRATDGGWLVRILDDGVGLGPDPLEDADGHGLMGMRERARLLGGHLDLGDRPGGGTEVTLSVPSTRDPG